MNIVYFSLIVWMNPNLLNVNPFTNWRFAVWAVFRCYVNVNVKIGWRRSGRKKMRLFNTVDFVLKHRGRRNNETIWDKSSSPVFVDTENAWTYRNQPGVFVGRVGPIVWVTRVHVFYATGTGKFFITTYTDTSSSPTASPINNININKAWLDYPITILTM